MAVAAGNSGAAPQVEEEDDGEETDVDSNVVEDAEEVPLTIADADVWQICRMRQVVQKNTWMLRRKTDGDAWRCS